MNNKKKGLIFAAFMLVVSAMLITTASFAWFSMNTSVLATGIQFEAYSDSLFLEISQSRDSGFDVSTKFSPSDDAVRLVTLERLTDGAYEIDPKPVAAGERYSSAKADKNYYTKVETADTNDSYEGSNYLLVNSKLKDASDVEGYYKVSDTVSEITFTVNDSSDVYDASAGKSYYKKVGNAYILQSEDNGDVTDGVTKLYGLYEIALGNACPAGEVYDGESVYYRVASDGSVYVVGGLKLGSHLGSYYTIDTPDSKVTVAEGGKTYHVLNARGDYVSIGEIAKDTDLTDYLYWGRAYSGELGDSESGNTLSVIKSEALSDYYHHKTVYLRSAPDANPASNLRVESVEVAGEDSVTDSVTILFVATNGLGEVSRAIYDNSDGSITHLDRENASGDGILFETVLGDALEIVTVEIYIFFDGTDTGAKTENVKLIGQSVDIEFAIDKPDYIKN